MLAPFASMSFTEICFLLSNFVTSVMLALFSFLSLQVPETIIGEQRLEHKENQRRKENLRSKLEGEGSCFTSEKKES